MKNLNMVKFTIFNMIELDYILIWRNISKNKYKMVLNSLKKRFITTSLKLVRNNFDSVKVTKKKRDKYFGGILSLHPYM